MIDLDQVANDVSGTFRARSQRLVNATLYVKILSVVFASVTAVCTFSMVAAGQPFPPAAYIGIGSAIFIALSSLYSVFVEKDASNELEMARVAVELARQAEKDLEDLRREYSDFERYEIEQERANELYSAMGLMRGVIETVTRLSERSAVQTISKMLEVASRSLSISLGFQMAEHFTLCVYIAERDQKTQKTVLRCIAQKRTQECPIENARLWPSGVGVAGAAYARNNEIVVPDLTAVEIGSLYGHNSRDGDEDKYKSIAVVPIATDGESEPWGVVVATSNRANHFIIDISSGVHAVEGVRALAAMAALAVALEEAALGQTPVSTG